MFTTCWYRWVSLCDKHLSHCHAFSLCDHHVTQKTQSNIFPLTACLNCFSAEWNCDRSWWPKNTCVPLTLFSRQRYTYWSRRTRFRASTRSSGWRCHPSSLTAPPHHSRSFLYPPTRCHQVEGHAPRRLHLLLEEADAAAHWECDVDATVQVCHSHHSSGLPLRGQECGCQTGQDLSSHVTCYHPPLLLLQT